MSSGQNSKLNGDLLDNQQPSTEVYAVHGADPEVQAYGMAKYSRSALSMRESLAEINDQKAEKFLNTFYFQYGHRSIADLAHIAFAIERLSILAATVAVDEPRWDGQERSTRYQDFQKSGYYVPDFADDAAAAALYRETVDLLFAEYRHFSEEMFRYLLARTPKPPEMKQEAYERTLRARAFDISRYLLPLAANTSLGQIVSARTLENQVSRLLSHTHAEVRRLGELLKQAAQEPAYDVGHGKAKALLQQIERESPAMAEQAREFLLRPVTRRAHPDEVLRTQRLRNRNSPRLDRGRCGVAGRRRRSTLRRPSICSTTIRSRSSLPPRCSISTRITPTGRFVTW